MVLYQVNESQTENLFSRCIRTKLVYTLCTFCFFIRSEALQHFEYYTWDTTDFAVKEVTRYQSVPGQATAYMLGKLKLVSMRKQVERALGKSFSLQEFHYQLLSQGSAPLGYLQSHIDKYIDCYTEKIAQELCSDILKYSEGQEDEERVSENELEEEETFPPRPPKRSFI